jgi:AcrR family transcriptional regulator
MPTVLRRWGPAADGKDLADRRRRLTYDQRRRIIVDAAVEVFAEKGYSGAAVVDVSDRAGITKTTLYDHFPSKREMHLAVLEMQRDDALNAVLPRIAVDLPPKEAVANALDVFFEWAEANPNSWRLLFGESYGDPDIARRHRELQSEAFLAIASGVLGVRKPRSAKARARLQAVAEIIGGAVHGLARWWWYDHRDTPRADLVAAIMDVLWPGLERLREDDGFQERVRPPSRKGTSTSRLAAAGRRRG